MPGKPQLHPLDFKRIDNVDQATGRTELHTVRLGGKHHVRVFPSTLGSGGWTWTFEDGNGPVSVRGQFANHDCIGFAHTKEEALSKALTAAAVHGFEAPENLRPLVDSWSVAHGELPSKSAGSWPPSTIDRAVARVASVISPGL